MGILPMSLLFMHQSTGKMPVLLEDALRRRAAGLRAGSRRRRWGGGSLAGGVQDDARHDVGRGLGVVADDAANRLADQACGEIFAAVEQHDAAVLLDALHARRVLQLADDR